MKFMSVCEDSFDHVVFRTVLPLIGLMEMQILQCVLHEQSTT